MNFIQQIQRLERLDQLIRLKATGNACLLARKLEISDRQLYNLLNVMKNELNAPVVFDNSSDSYIYTEAGRVKISYMFDRKKSE